jgi:hypothetical protein
MTDLNDYQKKAMMSLVVTFLQDLGFDRSSKTILSEIQDKIPALEPSADDLQKRHAAPIEYFPPPRIVLFGNFM